MFPKTEVPLPPRFFFRVFRKARTREKGGAKEKKKGENSPLTFPSLARLLPLPKKKNSRPGAWQVLRRRLRPDGSDGGTVCVWSSEERPSLKKVSLEILTDPMYQ